MAFPRPKFKNFLGEHTPRLPQVWVAFGKLTFLSLRAPSKFYATLLTTGILYLNMKSIPKDGRGDLVYKGLEVEEGGGCILKTVIAKGGTIFICNYLGGVEVLIHHTFLKTPAPVWDVINDRSLTMELFRGDLSPRFEDTWKFNESSINTRSISF